MLPAIRAPDDAATSAITGMLCTMHKPLDLSHLCTLVVSLPFALASLPCAAQATRSPDPTMIEAIAIMSDLKIRPADLTRVLRNAQHPEGPVVCVYFLSGDAQRVAISGVGKTRVTDATGREQGILCRPGEDLTPQVKELARDYIK